MNDVENLPATAVLAPWRSPLTRALDHARSRPESRYVQLATVHPNGRPANRTVVFRGFLDGTNSLQFVSDRRSEKIHHLAQNPWVEVCWYFPITREQFRLAGSAIVVGNGDSGIGNISAMETTSTNRSSYQRARQAVWQTLSDAARQQFAWPDPKQPRCESNRCESNAWQDIPIHPTLPTETFCLLVLEPDQVDYLELHGEPHPRWIYHRHANQWSSQAVNP